MGEGVLVICCNGLLLHSGSTTADHELRLDHPFSTDQGIRHVVLHEFGHALGCEHEHQSPLAALDCNEEIIFAEMADPSNRWSREKTNANIIKKLKADNTVATIFDRESIILYQYPATWFKNADGQGTPNNTNLSTLDIKWIKVNYPAYPTDVGQFSTLEIRPWDGSSNEVAIKTVTFVPPYRTPPSLAMGLTWLDLDYTKDLVVAATARDILEGSFAINIISETSSNIFSATCS